MAIDGTALDAALVTKYEDVLRASRVTKASGALLEILSGSKESTKARQLVQNELKELWGLIGKAEAEQSLLPVLQERAERVLEGN